MILEYIPAGRLHGGYALFSNTAKFAAKVAKRVCCEKCHTRYVYDLSRTSTARSYAKPILIVGILGLVPLSLVAAMPLFFAFIPMGGGGFILFIRFRIGGRRRIAPLSQANMEQLEADDDARVGLKAAMKLRRQLERGVEPVRCPKCGWYQKDMVREARSIGNSWTESAMLLAILASQPVAFYLMRHWRVTDWDQRFNVWLLCTAAGGILGGLIFGVQWLLSQRHSINDGFPEERPPFLGAPPAILETDHLAALSAVGKRIAARSTAIQKYEPPPSQATKVPEQRISVSRRPSPRLPP